MATGNQPDPDRPSETAPAADTTAQDTSSQKESPMEIHPPLGPIHTRKQFFIHLLTIVIGILIALGLDAAITWGHERAQVREARANLANEIGHNRETIDNALKELPGRRKGLETIIYAMRDMEAGKPGPQDLTYTFIGYDLYATAWQTAADSGATAHMDYDELKQYTELYNMQQIFMNVQMDAFRATADISDVRWVLERDRKNVSKERLEQIETAAARYMTILDVLTDAAQQLSKKYAAFEQRLP
jgi:hypothetical protein